jgi:hypothetical protein
LQRRLILPESHHHQINQFRLAITTDALEGIIALLAILALETRCQKKKHPLTKFRVRKELRKELVDLGDKRILRIVRIVIDCLVLREILPRLEGNIIVGGAGLEEIVQVALLLAHGLHGARILGILLDRIKPDNAVGAPDTEGIRIEFTLEVLLIK